jgi:hypothetical protein
MSEFLSFGMVGGGIGSLIGEVHRKAAAFNRLSYGKTCSRDN